LHIDNDGFIHLAGNMHSMIALHKMIETEEDKTTYPMFMRGQNHHCKHGDK